MSRDTKEELEEYLSDIYSLEKQAMTQLEKGPEIAETTDFKNDLRKHKLETEGQIEKLKQRLDELGTTPSAFKDGIMKLGGVGFLAFAKTLSETPGRLLAHSYAFEALESAGYRVLAGLAERASDPETQRVAQVIGSQEQAMLERLETHFEEVGNRSHAGSTPDELKGFVVEHLREAHALEKECGKILESGLDVFSDEVIRGLFKSQLSSTREISDQLEKRLGSLNSDESTFEDIAMKIGASSWSAFFKMQKDTAVKYLPFVIAMYHLKIAGYKLLSRVAIRSDDTVTAGLCSSIIETLRESTDRIEGVTSNAIDETLASLSK